jgi:hypothetical protein
LGTKNRTNFSFQETSKRGMAQLSADSLTESLCALCEKQLDPSFII